MTKLNRNELHIDDTYFDEGSFDYSILEDGYDKEKPIVCFQNGHIEDGNHRYKMFRDANRLDEVSIVMVDNWDYKELYKLENWEDDDVYYNFVKKIGQLI